MTMVTWWFQNARNGQDTPGFWAINLWRRSHKECLEWNRPPLWEACFFCSNALSRWSDPPGIQLRWSSTTKSLHQVMIQKADDRQMDMWKNISGMYDPTCAAISVCSRQTVVTVVTADCDMNSKTADMEICSATDMSLHRDVWGQRTYTTKGVARTPCPSPASSTKGQVRRGSEPYSCTSFAHRLEIRLTGKLQHCSGPKIT